MNYQAIIASTAFGLSILAANLAITMFGIVPVGFSLVAPAGVYFAGLTFSLRDWLHEVGGRAWVVAAITCGAILSAFLSGPVLAFASGTAFLVSEFADYAVYAPLRSRSRIGAMIASNTVGTVVDSVLFLSLAFGSLDYLAGQIVGKSWMTGIAVLCIIAWNNRRSMS